MGFFDDFFGDSQREDIERGAAKSREEIDRGLNNYIDTRTKYLDRSLSEYDPYSTVGQTGVDSLALLKDALGVGGGEAQSSFYNNLMQDPAFTAQRDAGVQAMDASAAARGLLRSGGQNRDLYTFGNRLFGDFANNRLSQLSGLTGQALGTGMGVAGARSGLLTDAGTGIADARFGAGQLFANNATNTANAMAQSRSTGINNILGFINAGANVAKAFNPATFMMPGAK